MREIKFRAWNVQNKKMFTVPTLDFGYDGAGKTILTYIKNAGGYDRHLVNDETMHLMQYTGLKDKNGKEIYEGDIFETGGDHFTVEWSDANAQFALDGLGDWVIQMPDGAWYPRYKFGTVIGNIYENPDLLNV